MTRLAIVPDEKYKPLVQSLQTLLTTISDDLDADNLAETLGDELLDFLRSYNLPEADQEIVVWARSERSYLAIWSSLLPEEDVVGSATADLTRGIVARVFQSGQPATESAMQAAPSTWTNLEARRGRNARITFAAPLTLYDRSIAVVTLSDYREETRRSDEDFATAARLAESATIFDSLAERYFVRVFLGLET